MAREDYDEAKRIKAGIDRLKVEGEGGNDAGGGRGGGRENYDEAKQIKAGIDLLLKVGRGGEDGGGVEGGLLEGSFPSRPKNPL